MDEILSFTLKEIGGAAAILAAFSAFLGAIWKNRIHMREKYQFDAALKQIEASHASQTPVLEHELQSDRHAAQTGHAKIIEKRASIIDNAYKLLAEIHEAIYDTIRPDYFGRDKTTTQPAYELALPKFDS